MNRTEIMDKIHEINLNLLIALDEIAKRHGIKYYLCFGALLGAVRHRDFIPWDNDVDIVMTRAEFNRLAPFLKTELDPELYELILPEDYGRKYFDMVPRINYKKAEIVMDKGYCEYYNGLTNRISLDFFFLDRVPDTLSGKILVYRLEFLYGLLNAHRYKLYLKDYNWIMKIAAVLLGTLGKLIKADTLRGYLSRLCARYEGREDIDTAKMTNDTTHYLKDWFRFSEFGEGKEAPIKERMFPGPSEPEKILEGYYGDFMTPPPENERIPHWGTVPVEPEYFIFYE